MPDFEGLPELRRIFTAHSRLMESVAQAVKEAAQRFAPNAHVRESISVTSIESNSGGRIIIDLKAIAPDARAYEYGSGIHSRISKMSPHQLGPKGKILIVPGPGKRFLAFPWDVAGPGIPRAKNGNVLLQSVEHPGVESSNNGEGYMRKAIKETKKQAKKDVALGVAGAVKLDIRARLRLGIKQ